MKSCRTLYGVRENTASSRQHAPRFAISLLSPQSARTVKSLQEGTISSKLEVGNVEVMGSPGTEPFVSADQAAQFLCVKRRFLLELARRGIAGAYGLGTGSKRKVWVFRLSELAASVERNEIPTANPRNPCTIESGSPR
jgi:hypothetical protein